uniref:Synaptobrevin, longin-like domain protein n=1 Tax=Tanacetum cinerariifolium TaxID=118510 RepID=A0A6L2JYZ7_TANCI|nr:hypothetical protein [Tanacetum cinerariifolium]
MVAILKKTEHNIDFHQIVDFLEASHIRYALTISPTIYVSHIRKFWSTARIKTTDQETKIIVTVDGKPRTISESSLRRHLKLNDEEGISSLPDAELFENLSLMGYNILPSQRFTFQKGQFSHQWKFFIHTIMQFLSHKSTGFNEFSSNIATAVVCLATNKSKALSPDADEPASLSRDDRYGEAFPTISSLDAGQDMENIAKTSAMSHESSPRDKERRCEEPIQEEAPITGGIIDIGEELGADKSTEKGSNDTEEMVNVLSSMKAANILSSGGAAFSTAASVSPADVFPTAGVPTVSGSFPNVSEIFTTASVATPYTRMSRGITIGSLQPMRIPIISEKDKGKEKVTETEVPKKKKLQEQIDAQVAVKYQDYLAEILKYQAQQSNPSSKKEQRRDKDKELWVELKRLFELDSEDQLWTYHQAVMHDPLDWKLYDTSGVHHVSTKKNQEILLVEKDYPLRKGLATVMIGNLIGDAISSLGEDSREKMLQGIPTASYGDPPTSAFSHC